MSDSLLASLAASGIKMTRLVTDSRVVQPGDTFVAYPGEHSDGRDYIEQAVAKGANAVIWQTPGHEWRASVPNLGVSDLRHKTGWIADAVYGEPSDRLWMVGVTGTNGKTSTCHWIAQCLNEANKKCALIGTLGNGFAGQLQESANTTPDAIKVHGLLADFIKEDAAAVAMEVSSHALAEGRVNGVRFDVALLTNLSRDHLDYHGDMESYAATKRRLFDWRTLKTAVVNLDDPFGRDLAQQLQDASAEVVAYGLTDETLAFAERSGLRMVYGNLKQMSAEGMQLDINSSWGGAVLQSSLIGRFNASNLLGVLAVLLVSGIDLKDAVNSLAKVSSVPGRMQKLGGMSQPAVIVDYAHTPDALEKVLLALRDACVGEGGRLICVFGCGGDRDRGKRAMMGRIAVRFSDLCIVTSDNPRSEDPLAIIEEIKAGIASTDYEVVVLREEAIARAIALASDKDTILLAGKGHENYQEIKGVKYPFSDVQIALQALQLKSASITGGVL